VSHKIDYYDSRNFGQTVCPYGEVSSKGSRCYVGDESCRECMSFDRINEYKEEVFCNHEEETIMTKDQIDFIANFKGQDRENIVKIIVDAKDSRVERIPLYFQGDWVCYVCANAEKDYALNKSDITTATSNEWHPIPVKKTIPMTKDDILKLMHDNPDMLFRIKGQGTFKTMVDLRIRDGVASIEIEDDGRIHTSKTFGINEMPESIEYITLIDQEPKHFTKEI
jgi:hypothetical protein